MQIRWSIAAAQDLFRIVEFITERMLPPRTVSPKPYTRTSVY